MVVGGRDEVCGVSGPESELGRELGPYLSRVRHERVVINDESGHPSLPSVRHRNFSLP